MQKCTYLGILGILGTAAFLSACGTGGDGGTLVSGAGGNGSGGKSRQRDERLTITDRALRAFTERLQRAPRQVVRHAPGGTPLWSLYVFVL